MRITPAHWLTKPPPGYGIDREHSLANGLIGAWLLNEGGGTKAYDLSGNGLTLTNASPAHSTWVPAKFGTGLSFDGSTATTWASPTTTVFSFTSFTFACWINVSSYVNGAQYFLLGSGAHRAFLINVGGANALNLRLFASANTISLGQSTSGLAATAAGLWFHLAFVWTGGSATSATKAYVNGVAATTTPLSAGTYTGPDSNAGQVCIGNSAGGVASLTGTIDNVACWSRALSLPDIKILASEPFAHVAKSNVFRWFAPPTLVTGASAGGPVLGGTAAPGVTLSPSGAGGPVLGGVATTAATFVATSAGGPVLGGAGAASATFTATAAGGPVLGGTAAPGVTYQVAGHGGLVLGGVATTATWLGGQLPGDFQTVVIDVDSFVTVDGNKTNLLSD